MTQTPLQVRIAHQYVAAIEHAIDMLQPFVSGEAPRPVFEQADRDNLVVRINQAIESARYAQITYQAVHGLDPNQDRVRNHVSARIKRALIGMKVLLETQWQQDWAISVVEAALHGVHLNPNEETG